jgi:anti-sigma factor RsiW
MLDHFIATNRNTAGRYMLGELSSAERERFEEHYFNCRQCAEDVRDLLAISSNSRAALLEMPDREEPAIAGGWKKSNPLQALRLSGVERAYVMAAALFLCPLTVVTTLQSIALRSQLAPQAVSEFTLHPDARGEEIEIGAPQTGQFVVLSADVPLAAPKLQWQVRGTGSQKALMEGVAPSPTPGSPFCVLIPASKLRVDQYVLAVRPDGVAPATSAEVLYRFRMH